MFMQDHVGKHIVLLRFSLDLYQKSRQCSDNVEEKRPYRVLVKKKLSPC